MNSTFISAKLNSAQCSVTALVHSSLELLFLGRAIVKLGASSKMHANSKRVIGQRVWAKVLLIESYSSWMYKLDGKASRQVLLAALWQNKTSQWTLTLLLKLFEIMLQYPLPKNTSLARICHYTSWKHNPVWNCFLCQEKFLWILDFSKPLTTTEKQFKKNLIIKL